MRCKRQGGFTLVELLTVLVILGILAALLIPRLTRSRMRTFHNACVQNMHNMGTAMQTYANDNDGKFPTALNVLLTGDTPVLKALPTCPSDESSYEPSYTLDNTSGLYTLSCNGIHYRQLDDVQQGFPQFYSSGRLEANGPGD